MVNKLLEKEKEEEKEKDIKKIEFFAHANGIN